MTRHQRSGAAGGRPLYADLDGTLLGPDGQVVPDTLAAIADARAAGFEPVLCTGRSRPDAVAIARLLGIEDVVCELGAIVLHGEAEHRTKASRAGLDPPPLTRVLATLRRAGVGPTQEHEPGAPRVAGLVLRSIADTRAVTAALAAGGLSEWWAVENGNSDRPVAVDPPADAHGAGGGTSSSPPARVLHVLPRGIDKRAGVSAHRALLGLAATDCAAIGDTLADLDLALPPAVARTVLVASADVTAVARARELGVPVTAGSYAAGAREAVAMLAGPAPTSAGGFDAARLPGPRLRPCPAGRDRVRENDDRR